MGGACQPQNCGNGTIEGGEGEECDRGDPNDGGENGNPGSGCTASCQYECDGNSDCTNNNSCDGTETCDDVSSGSGLGKTCNDSSPLSADTICDTSPNFYCSGEPGNTCNASFCGDGIIDSDEMCDPGGGLPGAALVGTCTTLCAPDAGIDPDDPPALTGGACRAAPDGGAPIWPGAALALVALGALIRRRRS